MNYRKNQITCKITDLKFKLRDTEYVSNKISEATAKYLVDGDKTELLALYEEYKPMLAQRQAWRDEINEAERQLNEINKELNNGTL